MTVWVVSSLGKHIFIPHTIILDQQLTAFYDPLHLLKSHLFEEEEKGLPYVKCIGFYHIHSIQRNKS